MPLFPRFSNISLSFVFRRFWSAVRDSRIALCPACNGTVRPNVVFFGEGLPEAFTTSQFTDLKECDLLLVMGTTLSVYPFASLVSQVGDLCPRVLFNREAVGCFTQKGSYRDVTALGDIDASIDQLVSLLGWQHVRTSAPRSTLRPPPPSVHTRVYFCTLLNSRRTWSRLPAPCRSNWWVRPSDMSPSTSRGSNRPPMPFCRASRTSDQLWKVVR